MSFLRIKIIFLALYCLSPTFAVNDIAKFVNTCFTFISYHIWPRHLQFRCTKAVRRYLKRPPFFEGATVFWGGHRWPGGPPVAPDGKRHPYIGTLYIYIYIYIYIYKFYQSTQCMAVKGYQMEGWWTRHNKIINTSLLCISRLSHSVYFIYCLSNNTNILPFATDPFWPSDVCVPLSSDT